MFKKSDKVEYISTRSGYPLFQKNKQYTVSDYYPDVNVIRVELADDGRTNVAYPGDNFKLVGSQNNQVANPFVATSQPTPLSFKPGVFVEAIADAGGMLSAGKVYKIESLNLHDAIYVIDDQGHRTSHWSSRFKLASTAPMMKIDFSNAKLTIPNTDRMTKELKPCTCPSLELMRKGCVCGSIEKRVWGIR